MPTRTLLALVPTQDSPTEILELTRVLCELLPEEAEALAVAALVRYAEARRPARLDEWGAMVPLAEQDPALWRLHLIEAAESYLTAAAACRPSGYRSLQAAIHSACVHAAQPDRSAALDDGFEAL